MLRLAGRPDWLASRNRDSETAHSHAFRFGERACVRAGQCRPHLVNARVARVADGISIRHAKDRQPAAIQSCCRNFLAPR